MISIKPIPPHPLCDNCGKSTPIAIYCCYTCLGLFCLECVTFVPTDKGDKVLCLDHQPRLDAGVPHA